MVVRRLHRSKGRRIFYFFPFQLVLLHLKQNHFLLLIWIILFAIATGVFAPKFGVPLQFLIPEYRGATGVISFGIVGFALGGFITGHNLYTYITHGYRFPLIATLSRPFQKFSLNNALIPVCFVATYIVNSAVYQVTRELIPWYLVILNIVALLFGISLFQSLSYIYFSYTNKDAKAFQKGRTRRVTRKEQPIDSPIHNPLKWLRERARQPWQVETYLIAWNKVSLARDSEHYDKAIVQKVFSQNNINAARFEIALVISFLVIGSLREFNLFLIPAAASLLLLFTISLMLVSALHSWIKGWTFTVIVFLLMMLNFFYSDVKILKLDNKAYGLDYDHAKVQYNPAALLPNWDTVKADQQHSLQILENWRKKLNPEWLADKQKPKMVIILSSGGGLRSAFWTARSLVVADSMTDGRLLNHCVLMTGASGGMLGSAYLRDLLLLRRSGEIHDLYNLNRLEDLSKDLLNPVVLSLATNDLFVRYQQIVDGPFRYTKDRAWAFEKQFDENTHGLLNHRLRDYAKPEALADIPMMILTPTIINDGRRLLISPQPLSYLATSYYHSGDPHPQAENVEFRRMFREQQADHLRFITALRMNSTFPYIFPIATLPSEPAMEVMDAGLRDNFGVKLSTRFIDVFRDWINTNTSGVVFVQVRDLPRGVMFEQEQQSLFSKLTAPLGSVYGNLTKTQDYSNDQMLSYLQQSFDVPVDVVTFQLQQSSETHVSLSWHLTAAEKEFIRKATEDPFYKEELNRLAQLLNTVN